MSISEKMIRFGEQSSWIRKMFEEGARLKARYGAEQVCDFSLGNPDVPPPARFYQELKQTAAAQTPGQHAYMPNGGLPWVREAIATRMSAEQEVVVDSADMLMCCGAAGGLNVIMKALLNPGDEVILLAPFFVEYRFYVDNHGGVSVVVPTRDDFTPDVEAIKSALTEKTKAIIINSPNNPTGQLYSDAMLAEIGDVLEQAEKQYNTTIYLISDEPYRKIVFDDLAVPAIFSKIRNSIVVSSFSKDLSLPGERIGYLAVHPDADNKRALVDAMTLATRILGFVNAPAFMQRVSGMLQEISIDHTIYQRRRDVFCTILSSAGYEFIHPKGAFYLFPRTPIEDDVRFCEILQDQKILAVPGRGFGAPGYIRLAFCVDEAVISRAKEGFVKAMAAASG
ncbi:MAG: pyridoxal phosphate-dependent aminotransferase [Desulfofustis sp. PB-SRB1]|jgi:aspartate aminotransferase|nr:pyridoxal phosphate-dependent aminotransferase [Desulfofustis sp. PB-SRB1]MBM1001574.1 pyridoxal phosphate-dependent aminotransferase [Desulfofustis sp. PB-SRB1]HBH28552.1 pyridoxal phosphate-dependent aminotransferase [Desulfofustis sp.]HBH31922.1 pyridoxal phosphate-dependent aminotransferase [Desulfofustis sp.]